jgi:hypothetical protein
MPEGGRLALGRYDDWATGSRTISLEEELDAATA